MMKTERTVHLVHMLLVTCVLGGCGTKDDDGDESPGDSSSKDNSKATEDAGGSSPTGSANSGGDGTGQTAGIGDQIGEGVQMINDCVDDMCVAEKATCDADTGCKDARAAGALGIAQFMTNKAYHDFVCTCVVPKCSSVLGPFGQIAIGVCNGEVGLPGVRDSGASSSGSPGDAGAAPSP